MTESEFEKDSLVSDLYGAIGKDHPPSETDREILARAYEMKPAKTGSPFSGGWKIPLSLAAVLVVGLAVVLRLGVSPEQPLPEADQVIPKMKKERVPESESVPLTTAPEKARMSTPAPMVEMEDAAASSEVREQKQKPVASDLGRGVEMMGQAPARRKGQTEDKNQPETPAGILQMKKAAEPSEAVAEEVEKAADETLGTDNRRLPSTEGLDEHLKSYGSMDQFLSPEYWKQEISLLVLGGEIEEARLQLRLLKEAFPDYDASELDALFGAK